MRWRLLAAATLAIGELVLPAESPADIILDEFTDPAVVESPAMENVFVETLNIGEIQARREIRIASSAGDPFGSFDIDVTVNGQMSVQISDIQRTSTGFPLTAPQFNYFFAATDVTEGGKHDAILFDFVNLHGANQPTYLRAIVRDNTNLRETYEIRLFPLVPMASSFTLAAPFDSFTIRGGASGLPDPTTLKEINFDFFFLGHHGEIDWSAQLERIRFGSNVVPEPTAFLLVLTGIVAWGLCRFHKKGVKRCGARLRLPGL